MVEKKEEVQNKMREYKCIKIGYTKEDTEKELNELVKLGWKVVCSYAFNGEHLILEKEKSEKELMW